MWRVCVCVCLYIISKAIHEKATHGFHSVRCLLLFSLCLSTLHWIQVELDAFYRSELAQIAASSCVATAAAAVFTSKTSSVASSVVHVFHNGTLHERNAYWSVRGELKFVVFALVRQTMCILQSVLVGVQLQIAQYFKCYLNNSKCNSQIP